MKCFFPIRVADIIDHDGDTIKLLVDSKIVAIGEYGSAIYTMLSYCNGLTDSEEIIRQTATATELTETFAQALLDDLSGLQMIIDSRELLRHYHKLTKNPTNYYRRCTDESVAELRSNRPNYCIGKDKPIPDDHLFVTRIEEWSEKRYSCRGFNERPIEKTKVFTLCRAAYNIHSKPVASAGGLYPLSVFVYLRKEAQDLETGLYQYNEDDGCLYRLKDVYADDFAFAVNDEDGLFNAACIFFVAADITRHMAKYANRGYRFTILEVGHVLQNLTLAAIEMGIDSVEYGGFKDDAVKRMIGLPESIEVIACWAAGYRGENERTVMSDLISKRDYLEGTLFEKNIVDGIRYENDADLNESSLNVAVSHYRFDGHGNDDNYGTGIANTFVKASIKSLMESYERYVCSLYYYDTIACAKDLPCYLDPAIYAPYSTEQADRLHLARFSPEKEWQWLRGETDSGKTVYIPVDLCFYPLSTEAVHRDLIHYANSNGCAAHFNIDIAKKSAVMELVERDALMRCWLARKTPRKIGHSLYPEQIQRRIKRYEQKGFTIDILLLDSDYAFTVLACARNDIAPYFVCGAAASDDFSTAVIKALNELEYSIIIGMRQAKMSPQPSISPENVTTPVEHGNLYKFTNLNETLEFLFSGDIIERIPSELSFKPLATLEPVYVVYKDTIKDVHIVRAFVEDLVPINFGTHNDFYNHHAIRRDECKRNGIPHFFA